MIAMPINCFYNNHILLAMGFSKVTIYMALPFLLTTVAMMSTVSLVTAAMDSSVSLNCCFDDL